MSLDPWFLVVEGRFEEALSEYRQRPKSQSCNEGLCLLNLNRLDEARDFFAGLARRTGFLALPREAGNERQRSEGRARLDHTQEFLGVVYWWLGRKQDAVAVWEHSVRAVYQDRFRILIPSLLAFAGIRLGDSRLERKALTLLRKKFKPEYAGYWDADVAGFLLGEVDEASFLHPSTEDNLVLEERRQARLPFWLAARTKDPATRRALLEKSANVRPGAALLECEVYLARAELAAGG